VIRYRATIASERLVNAEDHRDGAATIASTSLLQQSMYLATFGA
jgi:hypothetical protein